MKICLVMESFGDEFNGKYLVVINGNVVKKSFSVKRPALRWCVRYSCNSKNYVELWYQDCNGKCSLLECWN